MDTPSSCKQVAASACDAYDDPQMHNRRACMTPGETQRLHQEYRRVAEHVAEHKAKGKLHLLTEGSEMEGPWLSAQSPTIECVRVCGDGAHGPDGQPLLTYE